jgi:alkanesulfonate monooxygenase
VQTLEVFGTATVPRLPPTYEFRPWLSSLSRRAERHGLTGLLVFYDHMILDPWTVATVMLQQSGSLVPLVAMQPYSMPPFTAAKLIASLVSLYRRRIDLNIVTGASPEELDQIGNGLDHEQRYARATEYVLLLRLLLATDGPVSWDGEHYRVRDLRLNCHLPEELRPRFFVAGSSDSARRLGERAGDVMITHPEPVTAFAGTYLAARKASGCDIGVRLGIIARDTAEEAWAAALQDHRVDRAARLRTLLKRESHSDWNRRLATLAATADVHDEVYWTGPYSTGRTGAPFLVGSHAGVAAYLDRYLGLGVNRLLLTGLDTEDQFRHTSAVLSRLSVPQAGTATLG